MTGEHSDDWRELTRQAVLRMAEAKRNGRGVNAAELARSVVADASQRDTALTKRLEKFICDMLGPSTP